VHPFSVAAERAHWKANKKGGIHFLQQLKGKTRRGGIKTDS